MSIRFSVALGNPPYQVSDGGAGASAAPVYQYFSKEAAKIADISCQIQPSRWMTGGKGLDGYRQEMIHDPHMKLLVDYANSKDVFDNVDIKGGVCVYIRDQNYIGDCRCVRNSVDGKTESRRPLCEEGDEIFIREPMLVRIKNKITAADDFVGMDTRVSARKPYGLAAETLLNPSKFGLPPFSKEEIPDGYRVLGLGEKQQRTWMYLPKDYPIPKKDPGLDKYKVFIAEAYGCGELGEVPSTPVLSTPVLSTPGELCTETFLQIGPFETKTEAVGCQKYIYTKFFRACVGMCKQTQHATKKVYKYTPLLDFSSDSDIDWSLPIPEIDKQLYQKYGLDEEEIEFIESHVREMS